MMDLATTMTTITCSCTEDLRLILATARSVRYDVINDAINDVINDAIDDVIDDAIDDVIDDAIMGGNI